MTRAAVSSSKLGRVDRAGLIERRRTMRGRKSPEPAATTADVATAPDYAEPLCAWRLWEVEDLDAAPRLRSLYRFSFWPVGAPLEARCEAQRSEEHTSELQSHVNIVCRLLLEKKKKT